MLTNMSQKMFFYILISISIIANVTTSYFFPELLSGEFEHFYKESFLFIYNTLVIILLICATIFCKKVKSYEDFIKRPGYMREVRNEIDEGVYTSFGLLLLAMITPLIKKFVESEFLISLLNGFGLVSILIIVLIILDVITTIIIMKTL